MRARERKKQKEHPMILIGRDLCFFLADLRNELTKEQDSRQKLELDILELRRVRSKRDLKMFVVLI